MKRLKNLPKTKRLTNAFRIRNNASPGSIVGESLLTCHSTHQNLGLKRKQPQKWWRLLPACAFPFLFSPACWLELLSAILGHVEQGNILGTQSITKEGAWCQTFMSLFTDLLYYSQMLGNYWTKYSFLTWSFPNLRMQGSTILYKQKQK